MSANIEVIFPKEDQPSRIKKWRVNVGTNVSVGRILLVYTDVASDSVEKKMKAPQFGKVIKLLVKENEVVHPGQVIMELEGCKHPTVMKDLCAECGADLREEVTSNESPLCQANVPMVHSIPELKVTAELAEKIGREDKERLLEHKQLVLLVDLDQTIVHTTNDNIPAEMEDVYHFQLYGPYSPWYHTRLRPHTRTFLTEVSKLYELHICTFGARQYAHKVASILDSDGKLFSHRILSRDECFDPLSKTANLKALFPCGVDMVCIIDDRDDVWQGCLNLVQVKPYHFFLHTGDINVPPGLGKHDDPCPPKSLTEEALKEGDTVENGDDENVPKCSSSSSSSSNSEDAAINTKKLESLNSVEDRTEKVECEDSIKPKEEAIEKNDNVENVVGKEKSSEAEKSIDKISDTKACEKNSESIKNKDDRSDSRDRKKQRKDKHNKEEEEQEEEKLNTGEDQDDYLLYLEDILKRIHAEFYNEESGDPKSKTLKDIIPKVRSRVLGGLCITFSGLVPNNQRLPDSRAYKVARAFGAQVTQDLCARTTHLVAIHPGTVKCREAKREGKVKIVNPDWLWTCAERWEHVDERLYPLKEVPLQKAREFRKPPAHCSSPIHLDESEENEKNSFVNSINPLMVFSKEEIDNMDKEVDEDMNDSSDEENCFYASNDENEDDNINKKRDHDSDSDTEVYGYYPEPPSAKKRKRNSDEDNESSQDTSPEDDDDKRDRDRRKCFDDEDFDDDDDDPVTRFRRGEDLPDDLDLGDNSEDVSDLENDNLEDDHEWSAMGAALEREFLSE